MAPGTYLAGIETFKIVTWTRRLNFQVRLTFELALFDGGVRIQVGKTFTLISPSLPLDQVDYSVAASLFSEEEYQSPGSGSG